MKKTVCIDMEEESHFQLDIRLLEFLKEEFSTIVITAEKRIKTIKKDLKDRNLNFDTVSFFEPKYNYRFPSHSNIDRVRNFITARKNVKFLWKLISERKIKISSMKVGNSPIYLLPKQEPRLEKFSQHLKSKEKDAFLLLKEKKFLRDKEQDPAIRVALRAIRDFAIPFRRNGEIIWRYFMIPESER